MVSDGCAKIGIADARKQKQSNFFIICDRMESSWLKLKTVALAKFHAKIPALWSCGGNDRSFSDMKMKKSFNYDVAIIGGGSGGYAAARATANAGLKTAVIEGGKEVGGLCILRGCMPTKALLYAAEVKHLAEHAETWGVSAGKISFDFARVMARKSAQVKNFADYRVQQLNAGKFKFIRANAKFLDAHTLQLSNGKKLTARNFVIATGSSVAPSPLPQLNDVGFITSDDAVALKKLPKSLIILGGGAIACEFAQFFARFGVKVTLIQRSPHILKEFDSDAGMEIEKVFRREGIKIFTNTKLLGARRKGKLKSVSFEQNGKTISISAEEILFALGRIPNTASLGLENAGVKTESGFVATNSKMQSSAPHIFAAGDCTGPHEIVHIAVTQGEIAAHNIARPKSPRTTDHRLLISIVFTEPQVAFVGLTEKEAKLRGIKFLAASYPFNDHGKSLIMDAKDGFVKLLADPKSGKILGGACVGPVGGELIHEIVVAMAKRMTVHELAATPHYHPTLAEIWTYPAEELAEEIPS
jgi:dihydrolipoamide dehydrogenase